MKRTLRILSLAIILLITFGLPVLAYTYSTNIEVQETGGVSYAPLPIIALIDNEDLVDNYYIKSTGLDTRVIEGSTTEIPHMVAEDRTNFCASAIFADSTNQFAYTWGNSDTTSMYIIAGRDGYVQRADAVALEPGGLFEIEASSCYLSSTTSGSIVSKEDALAVYADGNGLVVGDILTDDIQSTPTSHSDPDDDWNNEANAYDDDTNTDAASDAIAGTSWGNYIVLNRAAAMCKGIRLYANMASPGIDAIDVDGYFNGQWHNMYQGAYADDTWEEILFADNAVYRLSSARFRFYNSSGAPDVAVLSEVDFLTLNPVLTASVAAVTGVRNVVFSADGAFLRLIVDSDANAVGQGAVTVPDNANDWYLLSEGTPYIRQYQHEVNSVLIVNYNPTTIIIGTTLPDKQGAAQDGTFTWGTNPSGLSVSIGSAVPGEQYTPAPLAETDPEDIIMPGGNINPADYTPPTAGTVTRAVYDLVDAMRTAINLASPISLPTTMTMINLSALLVVFIAIFVMAIKIPNNLFIAYFAGIIMIGAFIGMKFLPWWVIIIYVPLGIIPIIMERKPSL